MMTPSMKRLLVERTLNPKWPFGAATQLDATSEQKLGLENVLVGGEDGAGIAGGCRDSIGVCARCAGGYVAGERQGDLLSRGKSANVKDIRGRVKRHTRGKVWRAHVLETLRRERVGDDDVV